jgi:hypothetical protein
VPSHFARAVVTAKRKWKYRADKGPDHWSWGRKVRRLVRGVRLYFYIGDCEDYAFRVIWIAEGGKRKAIKAIRRGKYEIWHCTTLGDNGKLNHAAVKCVKTGEYAEVIFGRVTTTPDTGKGPPNGLGTIRMIRKASPNEALLKLGVIKPPYFSGDK